jgi:hypothetical protein
MDAKERLWENRIEIRKKSAICRKHWTAKRLEKIKDIPLSLSLWPPRPSPLLVDLLSLLPSAICPPFSPVFVFLCLVKMDNTRRGLVPVGWDTH